MESLYPHLLSPITIGAITIRNRIFQSGHSKNDAKAGLSGSGELEYQRTRAKGGVGLIVTGMRPIHPTTFGVRGAPLGWIRENIQHDRVIVGAVHEHGARIIAQIGHTGLFFSSDFGDDLRVNIGPSAIKSPFSGEVPKAMEGDDFVEIRRYWGESAEIAQEAGFDGIEMHFAHGYLINEFLSPLYYEGFIAGCELWTTNERYIREGELESDVIQVLPV